MGTLQMCNLQVCNLAAASYIPESLKDVFPSTGKRLKAAAIVKNFLQNMYYCPESAATYIRATVTTNLLLSDKAQTMSVTRSPDWPDYVTRCLETRGYSKEDILAVGGFLVEVEFVGKDNNILYILPQDKNTLFPNARPPEVPPVARMSGFADFDSKLFCKYLQKGKCHGCGARPAPGSKLQACSRCKKGCYCNRDCQVADWPQHKTVCKVLKEAKDVTADRMAKKMASNSSISSSQGVA